MSKATKGEPVSKPFSEPIPTSRFVVVLIVGIALYNIDIDGFGKEFWFYSTFFIIIFMFLYNQNKDDIHERQQEREQQQAIVYEEYLEEQRRRKAEKKAREEKKRLSAEKRRISAQKGAETRKRNQLAAQEAQRAKERQNQLAAQEALRRKAKMEQYRREEALQQQKMKPLMDECKRNNMHPEFIHDLDRLLAIHQAPPTFRDVLLKVWTPMDKPKKSEVYHVWQKWIMVGEELTLRAERRTIDIDFNELKVRIELKKSKIISPMKKELGEDLFETAADTLRFDDLTELWKKYGDEHIIIERIFKGENEEFVLADLDKLQE